ncbi:MAG: branched-chain amino acid aminotransferase [Peptococcaceae bacterium]|jgi:branched-chain amino acid aminotransferase|nr:branched-chain amino acid aminotransferase [Peptococcaceae bacterium]
MDISVTKNPAPKAKPDWKNLGFGEYFTDHMFMMDYATGKGWHDARIIPYGPLTMEPSAMVLHYAVEVFEGMKAYTCADGKIRLFRPLENAARLNRSAARFCMPPIPTEDFLTAICRLIRLDQDWVPKEEGTSLYIRPFMYSDQSNVGVRLPDLFKFVVILSPVGAYYKEGLNPVSIYVEDEYVRAARGGTGFTKCGGNYAASLIAQKKAKDLGYTQVLWLDGAERKYIEEVGTMNVMFKIGGEIVAPELGDSVLPGVTRNSALILLKSWGYKVAERKISVDELRDAAESGRLEEAFGTGTAAVISPIGLFNIQGKKLRVRDGKIGPVAQKLYDTITGIQWGTLPDTFGWTQEIN